MRSLCTLISVSFDPGGVLRFYSSLIEVSVRGFVLSSITLHNRAIRQREEPVQLHVHPTVRQAGFG
ncbi:hypothetical protein OFC55_27650, partial [Escherichia coli]|nr:hypothetical protein [Escherichia coli]